jgi:hypothetical protein
VFRPAGKFMQQRNITSGNLNTICYPYSILKGMREFMHMLVFLDRFCGLVVRVLGYRSGGPGSIPGTTRKEKVVGLERGPLSLVSTNEELLDRKVAAPV